MKPVIEIVPYNALPCEAEVFTIRGVKADKSDFGSNIDTDPFNAEDYACGYNEFEAFTSVPEGVLVKYNITEAEFRKIQEELSEKFCVGSCGWCI
jgi:hypothetical protein